MERRKKWTVIALLSAIIPIGLFVGFSTWNLGSSPMKFTFTWGPDEQDIVNGTLRIDVSVWFENFAWANKTAEMFKILVKVNVTHYSPHYELVLIFDVPKERLFWADNRLLLYSGNFTAFLEGVGCGQTKVFTCTYNPNEGYTFGPYGFAAAELMVKPENSTAYIPITIRFATGLKFVSRDLQIDTGKTEISEVPAYDVEITGVNVSKETYGGTYGGTEETYQVITVEGKIYPPVICKTLIYIVTNQEGKRVPRELACGGSNATNPDGSFKIGGVAHLPPGTYNVQAELHHLGIDIKANIVQFTIEE